MEETKKIESNKKLKLRDSARIIDSLPYIDEEIDTRTKNTINNLILSQMDKMDKNNYSEIKTIKLNFDV